MKSGTHTFLPTERVHFGAGSIEKLAEEVRSSARAFVVTGRSLYERTDRIRRIHALLGEKHARNLAGISDLTTGSSLERAA